MLKLLRTLFAVPSHRPELINAQVRAFTRQMPILYSVLVCNMLFVATTHFNSTPWFLTVVVPVIGITITVTRLVSWWRLRHAEYPLAQSIRRLRNTIWLAGGLGIGFTAWSLALFSYGNVEQKAHVVFFMAITMVACVFSLMHLRAASMLVAAIVIIPFVGVLAMSGSFIMYAIAANMALVTAVMLYMINTHYNDFATMVSQRQTLEQAHQTTLSLNAINDKLANLDTLTGMPNRRRFFARVDDIGTDRCENQGPFAIGLIDLDGFKAINDLYGHAYGDALLVEAAERMLRLASKDTFVARLGGDEFGFIMEGTRKDVMNFANSLCEALRAPFELREITVDVSASCGVAFYEAEFESAKDMFECADYALYQAKSHHNGHAALFSHEHRAAMRASHNINQALRGAGIADELYLVYQPIVDVATRRITCFEALARWRSPSLGEVPPGKFIAAAEASPLINKLTLVLLKCLLRDLAGWPSDTRASFNLSARNLSSPDTMLQIVAVIQMSGISPRRIDFEVTETTLMIDFDSALRSLTLLRNLGCGISLDDFGTGHSSLSYINTLPLDKIKIDRSFVLAMANNVKTREIVNTITLLGKKLGLACVAEGVETIEQSRLMQDCGCSLMQGFYFARPMTTEQVTHLVEAQDATFLSPARPMLKSA